MTKVLMIVSAADSLELADGTAHPTGFWAEELAASHELLRAAGAEVDVATPGGAQPTVDPISLDERGGVSEADAERFRRYLDSIATELAAPLSLADVTIDDYDAVYVPGGHGPMADLARDADTGRLLRAADARGSVVAVLCHGPAALLSTVDADGTFAFAGRRVTAFTDVEEQQGGLGERSPYLVESRLRELGAVIESGEPWTSTVVVDGTLISGQNPQSSRATAEAVLAALRVA
ncbi:type 1 glutamine amidotransferase domain-containing protein [Umezawaea beigongshangensis]|uniref:type 1 glutamine amidotransferase domain-containing protein n=1 Tax=Umezawaea beigongshangensis TaxID=2780383 RepID=UPI0018F2074D|nr:type 1 glutamine amidotransferase domain-containing protein [Umezawaea beigongshangensis]